MSQRGPNCPDCRQYGAMTRLPMQRAYVRRNLATGQRMLWPIGWYCAKCTMLLSDKNLAQVVDVEDMPF